MSLLTFALLVFIQLIASQEKELPPAPNTNPQHSNRLRPGGELDSNQRDAPQFLPMTNRGKQIQLFSLASKGK